LPINVNAGAPSYPKTAILKPWNLLLQTPLLPPGFGLPGDLPLPPADAIPSTGVNAYAI